MPDELDSLNLPLIKEPLHQCLVLSVLISSLLLCIF
uniref:Uncharacterized protein n=1 Tax=Arundo donax TaxID=35708 RepID=A0A0A8ZKG6_ARUDO